MAVHVVKAVNMVNMARIALLHFCFAHNLSHGHIMSSRLTHILICTVLSAAHCCKYSPPGAVIFRIGVTIGAYQLPSGVGVLSGKQMKPRDNYDFQAASDITFPELYKDAATGIVNINYDICILRLGQEVPSHIGNAEIGESIPQAPAAS